MNLIEILFFKIIAINAFMLSFALQLSGKCGYPGKPYKCKLEPDNKLHYLEGEEVTYQCLDYWSFGQTRKCVNGKWTGNMVRCGINVNNTQLKDVRVEDITTPNKPELMFEHNNMTLKDTWNFPNVFVTDRFPHKLVIHDTRKYRWTLRFTVPVVKLFTRIDFTFINLTLLSADEQQKINKFINISVDVSRYRKCALEHQTEGEKWRHSGLRIDTFFSCDSLSELAFTKDIAKPRNEIIMESQSSINFSYVLTGIFFGRAYGTPNEPICGEPEVAIGQKMRIIKQDIEYSGTCADEKLWTYVETRNDDLPGTAVHKLKCVGDMVWNGSYAQCLPSKPCKFSDLIVKNQSEVSSIENLYYHTRTQWYAIDGSHAYYGCAKSSDILVGKESRICQKNGLWTGIEPHCFNPSESQSKLPLNLSTVSLICLILGIFLVLVITLVVAVFYIHTKRVKRRIAKQLSANQNQEEMYEKYTTEYYSNEYDDIGEHSIHGKNIYDDYDKTQVEVRYAEAYNPNVNAYQSTTGDYCNITDDCAYLDMTNPITTTITTTGTTNSPKPLPFPRKSIKKSSVTNVYSNEITKL